MTKTSPDSASIEKFPSKSVETPRLVFSITTVAPGKGSPVSSVMIPVIVFCCANPICTIKIPKRDKNK
jgi:hypothetical protein